MFQLVPVRLHGGLTTLARLAPLALAGLLGCEPPPLPEADPASTAPSVRITWPPPESPVQGCEIVSIEVENFTLVEFPSSEIVEGEGHYHVYHPGGYKSCYKPYCFVDFSEVPDTTDPYFVVVLADTAHNELFDENGDRVEHQIPFEFVPGACEIDIGATGGG